MRIASLLVLAGLAGCRLYHAEADLRLVAVTPTITTGALAIRVETSISGHARLFDGEVPLAGTHPPGETIELTLSGPGRHALVARMFDGTTAVESPPLYVEVDVQPPALLSATPPSGLLLVAGPFEAVATFGEPLGAASRAELWIRNSQTWSPVQVPVEVTLEGPTLRLRADTLVLDREEGDYAEAVLRPCDDRGICGRAELGRWRAPTVDGFITVSPFYGSGVVTVAAQWTPVHAADLLVDGASVGRIEPGGTFQLDSRSYADGRHDFSLDVEGAFPLPDHRGGWAYFDNTPPHLVSCEPVDAPEGDVCARSGVRGVFDEVLGALDGAHWDGSGWVVAITDGSLPDPWVVDYSAGRDDAGNGVAAPATCTFSLVPWLRRFGDGPVVVDGEVLRAASFGFGRGLYIEAVEPGPDPRLRLATFDWGQRSWRWDWWTSGPTLMPTQIGSAPDRSLVAWLEPADAGRVRIASEFPYDLDPPPYADATYGPVTLESVGTDLGVAWTEGDALGRRVGRISWRRAAAYREQATAGVDPLADVLGMSVATPFVAVVEAPLGDPARLFVRRQGATVGELTPVGGALNADPGHAALRPAVSAAGSVAWEEDGMVRARRLLDVAAGSWSEAVALDADPSTPSRLPRALRGGRIVFLDRGPDGDRFEVRQWAGDEWIALASLPTGGEVATYTVSEYPLTIAWVDSSGAIRILEHNE